MARVAVRSDGGLDDSYAREGPRFKPLGRRRLRVGVNERYRVVSPL